eukprot:TRINITY_DN11587_c0_g1_i1.p1 TRINITY_DN11587_c0_g1~~TRINITY_DN11587_c0_g1_i1.p1  ORF type:complete len:411 (-),score=78.08 TRINITY_DN11587_c0_g1_i1:52-1227(-)
MKLIENIQTPALILDKEVVERNAQSMIETAKRLGVALRPHVKTHKTLEVGKLQRGNDSEVFKGIVASTLAEVKFFADGGFDNILYGVPLAPQKIPAIVDLANRITIHIMVDNEAIVEQLEQYHTKEQLNDKKFSVFVGVDAGYGREGVDIDETVLITLTKRIANNASQFDLQGIYSHSGHSYSCKTIEDLKARTEEEIDRISHAATLLQQNGVHLKHVSIGSTPVARYLVSAKDVNMKQVNEIHPGNYVFLDRQQMQLGAEENGVFTGVSTTDIAVAVLTTVISHYPNRRKFLIDAGSLALSKDTCGNTGFGLVLGHPELRILRVSQEVSLVERVDGSEIDMANFPIGSRLRVVPNHSCLTSALFTQYHVVDNRVENGNVILETWQPCHGW